MAMNLINNILLVLIKYTFILLLFDLRTLSQDCQNDECDCGTIAKPPGSEIIQKRNDTFEIYDETNEDYRHNFRVWYRCIDRNNILVGNQMRTCDRGKWLGSVPRCGHYF